MKSSTRHLLGDLILLGVALIWGMGFIAVKIGLNSGMSPFFLLSLRFLVAALALLPFQIKKLQRIKSSTIKHGLILGVLMFLGFTFQTFGLAHTTTSKNAFLTGVNVIIVPFFAYILTKKKAPLQATLAAVMTLFGIGLLTLNDNLSINLGDTLTLVCAVMFAGHISVTSMIAKDEPADTLVFVQMITAGFFAFLMTFILKEPKILTLPSLTAIIYLGVFSTMLAFVLQTIGQKYAHATKAAILLSTESLFGAFFAVLIFKDIMSWRMILGAIIIFISILLAESDLSYLTQRKSNQIPKPAATKANP